MVLHDMNFEILTRLSQKAMSILIAQLLVTLMYYQCTHTHAVSLLAYANWSTFLDYEGILLTL